MTAPEPSPDPFGLSRAEWQSLARDWQLPAYRGRQIFDAIHLRGARSVSEIHEVPRSLREKLGSEMPIGLPAVVRREPSRDGSVKYGLRFSDGALIEAVYMPGDGGGARVNEFEDARAASGAVLSAAPGPKPGAAPGRFTVCLSSQTGCAVDCAFCVTGRLGGGRNLTAGEIVGQLYAVLDDVNASAQEMRVVFMGMGEPFLNPDGVSGALDVLFEVVSPRRVTVSTSGITPVFARFASLKKRPNLAVSLNAADDETRASLMPIDRTYPLDGLLRAMREWPLEPRRRLTVEYVLIAGRNDSSADATRLAKLLSGIDAKVNVIPLNEDPLYLPGWKRPAESVIDGFAAALAGARIPVTVRRSRGPDASAACGQLKGRTEDSRKGGSARNR
ncbi:MAG: 23S rRNA (adenine(2503)-C(2))-methyltransferase RlmN [Acidobacteria bacterium]|nr:MAG: 23S rRNA (adenine(2503)-C(2))-methyltransferase RlmN [Acidobacteriota bacterium]PYQ68164.1 MAG: 23S rRNA (adenine(2503)-C(2))-methyltransferase RlmN [Acidobacteriota bacterium]